PDRRVAAEGDCQGSQLCDLPGVVDQPQERGFQALPERNGEPLFVHRPVRLARAPPQPWRLPVGTTQGRMTDRRGFCALGWAMVGLLLIDSVRAVIFAIPRHSIIDGYIGPLYFVDYSNGFIRRGLPGEVIRIVTGGHSRTSTEVAGWTLTLLATLAAIAIVL